MIAVVALVILGIGLLNMLAFRHAYAMMHFTRNGKRTNPPERLTLGGKFRVLFLGVNLPRPGTQLLPEAKAFLDLGASVLLVDFRGSGESSENYTTIGVKEAEDVLAAVGYAKKNLAHAGLILYGQSMGAAAILRAVHVCDVQPDAIIVEAVFDRMINTVRHRFEAMSLPSFPSAELLVFWGGCQAGFNGFRHDPLDYAVTVVCPILFLQGADDRRARGDDARRVFAAVSSPKQFKEFR